MWVRGEGDEEEKEGLNFFTQGKERKITEYIDFFYSLHHLYKYIESPPEKKENKKLLRKKKKRKEITAQYRNPQQ